MPLPAALQARLLKRGIIKTGSDSQPEEEIIAEDYDDHPNTNTDQVPANIVVPPPQLVESFSRVISDCKAAPGCPNKWNIYHECSLFCYERWGDGIRDPNPSEELKRLKMLRKYPLPKNWDEIYDPGTGRYYYWNTSLDEVSWMPPLHPRAKVSLPAARLRELQKHSESYSREVEMSDALDEENMDDIDDGQHITEKYVQKKREVHRPPRGGRFVKKSTELDPMDPAAYSDIPRGNWSTGLERQGEAKTGADTTAAGPLYQMRPYPSPGAVLRANAEKQGRK